MLYLLWITILYHTSDRENLFTVSKKYNFQLKPKKSAILQIKNHKNGARNQSPSRKYQCKNNTLVSRYHYQHHGVNQTPARQNRTKVELLPQSHYEILHTQTIILELISTMVDLHSTTLRLHCSLHWVAKQNNQRQIRLIMEKLIQTISWIAKKLSNKNKLKTLLK